MKKLNCLLLFVLFSVSALSQDLVWAIKSGLHGRSYQHSNMIATSDDGYVYRLTNFSQSDSIVFGSFKFINPVPGLSGYKILAKYTSDGDIVWAKQIDYHGAVSLSVDPTGNIYLTADQCGYSDIYKYSPAGSLLWQSTFVQAYSLSRVVTDPWGYAYYISTFASATLTIGGFTVTNTGTGSDVYVVKYAPSGSIVWVKNFGSPAADILTAAHVDHAGNLLIAANIGYDYQLLKFDSSATPLWTCTWLTAVSSNSEIHSITSDKLNNIFVCGGMAASSVSFNGAAIIKSSGSRAGFVVKLDASGTGVWGKAILGRSGTAAGYSLAIDTAGGAWVCGGYTGDTLKLDTVSIAAPVYAYDTAMCYTQPMFVARYDKNGAITYSMSAVSGGGYAIDNSQAEGSGLAADNAGNVYYTTDYCYHPYSFGGVPFPESPYSNALLAKFGPGHSTGVPPVTQESDVTIFPNPADREFSIVCSGIPDPEAHTLVFDPLGRQVADIRLSFPTTHVTTSSFAPGLYRCILMLNNKRIIRNILVAR